ncbi:hypothetical protein [Nocardia carnea]|uniref:hypothetical protein n=1 Tax=Nocardia carnea TaxID=37328 RepID=UPI002453AD1C|nr:hypothetical protein [Nocardia carnea]
MASNDNGTQTGHDVTPEWIDGPPPEMDHAHWIPPGVLLETNDGRTILVGHINQLGGLCNDCREDITAADVVRHRFVWRGKED